LLIIHDFKAYWSSCFPEWNQWFCLNPASLNNFLCFKNNSIISFTSLYQHGKVIFWWLQPEFGIWLCGFHINRSKKPQWDGNTLHLRAPGFRQRAERWRVETGRSSAHFFCGFAANSTSTPTSLKPSEQIRERVVAQHLFAIPQNLPGLLPAGALNMAATQSFAWPGRGSHQVTQNILSAIPAAILLRQVIFLLQMFHLKRVRGQDTVYHGEHFIGFPMVLHNDPGICVHLALLRMGERGIKGVFQARNFLCR